jgi:peptidoglycan/xylan/chitin deacetylase (PgdA/CDA1 family)
MKRSKKLFYSASSLLPTGILERVAGAGTLFPYHHVVSDQEVHHVRHLYPYKNVRQFIADLDHLLKHLRPAAVDEVVRAVLSGEPLPPKTFLLSFDDGFREVYEIIAPILFAKGVPGVFFVNPAFLDNRSLFYRAKISLVLEALSHVKDGDPLLAECWKKLGVDGPFVGREGLNRGLRAINNLDQAVLEPVAVLLGLSFDEYLRSVRPFMTSQEVEALGEQGFTIGAHSWDHPYYDLVSAEEQKRQTVASARYVQEHFSPSYNLFSFPHSDAGLSQAFFDGLFSRAGLAGGKAPGGLKGPVDVFFGIQNQKEEAQNRVLHRFNAERPDLPMSGQLNGILLWIAAQKLFNKNKVQRK